MTAQPIAGNPGIFIRAAIEMGMAREIVIPLLVRCAGLAERHLQAEHRESFETVLATAKRLATGPNSASAFACWPLPGNPAGDLACQAADQAALYALCSHPTIHTSLEMQADAAVNVLSSVVEAAHLAGESMEAEQAALAQLILQP